MSTPADAAPPVPVGLRALQNDLRPSELLVEYVLADPHSYALALWTLALQFAPAMISKKPIVLQTEGFGNKPFSGNVVLLVNRHTASAAETLCVERATIAVRVPRTAIPELESDPVQLEC